ncbi:MAG: hypothetical protein Q4B01_00530 [Eubacteriales bacterium]|nr:hypothetical protein [Eubacteriales bacterium]
MRWYRNLYLGEGLEKKKDRLIRKIEQGRGVPGVYVITLASNGTDLMDVFAADYLMQPALHRSCPMILGLCRGRDEAVDLSVEIVLDMYRQTGGFRLPEYLKEMMNRENADEAFDTEKGKE